MALGAFGHGILEEALLVPAIVAAASVLAIGWLVGGRNLPVSLALTIGFLAAFALIKGLDPVWPGAASDKLPWLALLGLIGAALAERRRWPWVGAVVIAGAVALVAWRRLADGPFVVPLAVAAAGILAWLSLRHPGGAPWRRHWTLGAIAFGLAGVALFARTLLLAELALACAAALLGSALRPAASSTALLPALAVLVGLGAALALFSGAPPAALVLTAAIAGAGWASRRLAPRLPVPEPAMFVGLGAAAAALAAGLTRWLEGAPLYYG